MDEVQALASQADKPFYSLSVHPCSFLLFLCGTLGWGQQSGEQPSQEEDYFNLHAGGELLKLYYS